MISIPAAKLLLFVALTIGPSNPQKIAVTSNSENYYWVHEKTGWAFRAQGFPSSDFTREPERTISPMEPRKSDDLKGPEKDITHHDWSHDTVMVFDNGDRVEKYKETGFYIVNAGGANQKVYTIRYDNDIISK